MIRVEQIRIKEFRGIRDLTLALNGKNYAICGRNGTGKSGVVDALEFALTGNISRLAGSGTSGISVKRHAPHVDSRERPDKALVELTITIPTFNKTVTITRTVKDAQKPTVTPSTPEVLTVLTHVAEHPEFVLSRRELITYVLATPGNRAMEVQALLHLDEVEETRRLLQKVANRAKSKVAPLFEQVRVARDRLLQSLDITHLQPEPLLAAVNTRRELLGLAPLPTLTNTTSLTDGLAVSDQQAKAPRVPKTQAIADLTQLQSSLQRVASEEIATTRDAILVKVQKLAENPDTTVALTREQFLRTAIDLVDGEQCPVCDTPWDREELIALITEKVKRYEEVAKQKKEIENDLRPLSALLTELESYLSTSITYATQLKLTEERQSLIILRNDIQTQSAQFRELLPLESTMSALTKLTTIPEHVTTSVAAIQTAVAAIPEPTQQDAARDYLVASQEHLKSYRDLSREHKRAKEDADLAAKVDTAYADVSTEVLNDVYKEVEKDFSDLYRFINREDEGAFEAELIPSKGKLGFDVDFYGRGKFPPGTYHSEGHQDTMGVCLYLALMKHLMGEGFIFAVLDDVLMSVDAGHRREVCTLLVEKFPNTQFILTTHDEIWLKFIKGYGLITPKASAEFRRWDVDHGPAEWNDQDVWKEIEEDLKNNDVRAAASLLRYYTEHVMAEVCHRLRARVEFRGDARFECGELLASGTSTFGELLKRGEKAARSWEDAALAETIAQRRAAYDALVTATNIEQWQVNPSIHYNPWADLQKEDFAPVVEAYKALLHAFSCETCDALFYVMPERGTRELLRCNCNATNINLKRKKAVA